MKQNDRYINNLKVFQSVQKNSWHRFVDLRLILTIWTWSTIWQQVIRKCQRIRAIPFFNGWGWDGTKILLFFATFRFLWLDLTSDRRLWGNGRRGQLSENQTNLVFAQSESDFAIRSYTTLWPFWSSSLSIWSSWSWSWPDVLLRNNVALLILTLIDNHHDPEPSDPDPHHDVLSRDLVAGQRKSVGCVCVTFPQ